MVVCRLDTGRRKITPCTIVIFGASGDLTQRKLIPALYHLHKEKQMPVPYRVIGFARRAKSDESWRQELLEGLKRHSRTQPVDTKAWGEFASRVSYFQSDFSNKKAYLELKELLVSQPEPELRQNLLFYLAVSPTQYVEIIESLSECGLLRKQKPDGGWQRLVVEKPFGSDLASARKLCDDISRFAHEKQIFRIDHYLGKETVQNMMMFRFSNSVFEPLWNRQMVGHVQITVSESIGVGGRGGYYEESGATRDMLQNHLLQVMALAAMEPPTSLEAEAIRDEKVKLIRSIRMPQPEDIVRGQYVAGEVDGEQRIAYRDEEKVDPKSNVETFVATRLLVDNWRWSGVPFYLRTGKNLPVSASEVRFQFKRAPYTLFAAQCGANLDQNSITLRLQPDEGITLHINGKVPGSSTEIRPVRMRFSYDAEFGAYTPEAYERLLLEAMAGDSTLFLRRDEVESAWSIADVIRGHWYGKELTPEEFYPAGTWGPESATRPLNISRIDYGPPSTWRNPVV